MMQWKKDGKEEEKELNIHCKPQIMPASENQEIFKKHAGGKHQKK